MFNIFGDKEDDQDFYTYVFYTVLASYVIRVVASWFVGDSSDNQNNNNNTADDNTSNNTSSNSNSDNSNNNNNNTNNNSYWLTRKVKSLFKKEQTSDLTMANPAEGNNSNNSNTGNTTVKRRRSRTPSRSSRGTTSRNRGAFQCIAVCTQKLRNPTRKNPAATIMRSSRSRRRCASAWPIATTVKMRKDASSGTNFIPQTRHSAQP